jgi:hypothetical protein
MEAHLMARDPKITEQRLQLLANGYQPICNADKRTFLKKWSTLDITPELITSWGRKYSRFTATGIRLAKWLAVIDVDVTDPELAGAILRKFEEMIEGWGLSLDDVLMRGTTTTKKEAWFVRTSETFNRLHTYRWRLAGAHTDEPTQCVEIFGGASARQFGSFGPHSVDDSGEVRSHYQWRDGISPLEAPLGSLATLSKQQFHELIDAADLLMDAAGLEQVKASSSGEDRASRVYDLTEEMVFQCNDGVDRSLMDLREVGDDLRCSASWLEGPEAQRRDRCLIGHDQGGGVTIWESASGVLHAEVSRKPMPGANDLDLEEVRAKLSQIGKTERVKVNAEDDFETVVAKLLEQHAFAPSQYKNAIPISSRELTDGITLANLRTKYAPWHEEVTGPRGGVTRINPVDVWINRKDRVDVAGIRCEPGADFPLFKDDGQQWVNTYRPPMHGGTGDIGPWLEFLEHLLPDKTERDWFSQAIAFKARNPGVPGPAILMVGRVQGAGRGTLFDIMERYWGERFTRTVPFTTFTGKTHQSQYNEWQVGSVMAFVNESSEATDGSTYQTKHNTYEHLKEVLDPRSRRIEVRVKGRDNYVATTHTSVLIASNHANALPISPDDRRICVLLNGGKMSDRLAKLIHAWKEQEGSMAALQQWLWSVDLTGYNPYDAPPAFTGKDAMADANRSELDDAFDDALGSIVGEVFCVAQLQAYIGEQASHGDLPGGWRGAVRRMVLERCYRVGTRQDGNFRVVVSGEKHVLYATSPQMAAKWNGRDFAREEMLKSGDPSSSRDVVAKLSQRLRLVPDPAHSEE